MRAAAASCSSDFAGTTTAPQSSANPITIDHTSASTCSSTLITQGARTNSRPCPAAQPDRAVPAIGCPPTNRGSSPAALTSSSTAPLTLITSVSGQSAAADSRICPSSIGSAGIGTARTIRAWLSAARSSASSRLSVASNPSDRAAWTPSTDRLYPKTSRPAALAARITDPPMRPRPSTQTGVFVTLQGWHTRGFGPRQAWCPFLVKAPGRGLP